MSNISFIDTAPDSNQIERAAKVGGKTVVVIMMVNRTSAISIKHELLPVLWVQLKAVQFFQRPGAA